MPFQNSISGPTVFPVKIICLKACYREFAQGQSLLNSRKVGYFFPVPEFLDPVVLKTSPKCSFSVIENERFGLVFAKTGSINSATGVE
jgi:hypothetical protein